MSELNFPTKFIRLTKATFTIMKCCVKIQHDCSKSFETRQGLTTLLFNVVLELIVRLANLQKSCTIYNKKNQQLAYADDIDIVSIRSQSAVRDAYLALKRKTAKVGLK
jgi:hypothetical protein